MCLLYIGGLASGGFVLTNPPHKGEYSFPHDALFKDPAQAMGLNASDCATSGPSLGSSVKGRGGQEELASYLKRRVLENIPGQLETSFLIFLTSRSIKQSNTEKSFPLRGCI